MNPILAYLFYLKYFYFNNTFTKISCHINSGLVLGIGPGRVEPRSVPIRQIQYDFILR